jgi:preprotein translocase SecF subunit
MAWMRLVRDKTTISFMKGRYAGLIVSAVLSLASVILFMTPGLNYGIDFKGGILIELRTEGPADFGKLRGGLEHLGLGPVLLQQFGGPEDVLLRLQRQDGGEDAQQQAVATVRETLARDFAGAQIRRVEAVGAAVSGDLFRAGMTALGMALIVMLFYIWFRFEWQFAVGAVVTLILDITKMIGFYALTGIDFNLTAIAAMLTVMGYSLNDKVVVYDRVRENLRRYKSLNLKDLIDRSINETLNRTIGTSMTIFLATLPLAIVGGESLRDFAIVMLFGIVIGTSSSIFIAAPILFFLGQKSLTRASSVAVNT